MDKPKLVMIGVRKKGESCFKITTEESRIFYGESFELVKPGGTKEAIHPERITHIEKGDD